METIIEAHRPTIQEGAGSSSWVDAATGVREEATFFGAGDDRLFGCRYEPPGEPVGSVVICCPFQAELLRNYRREVLLARRLASRGIAVQRFHYRGSGHSDGDTTDMTFETMVHDALEAGDALLARTGGSTVSFAGARFGGLVAASAAALTGGAVALWEPVVTPARYFDEIFRFRVVWEMKKEDGTVFEADDLFTEMRREGTVDILGYDVSRALYDSAAGRTLAEEARTPAAALLVQVGLGRTLRREYAGVVEALRARNVAVETRVIPDRETWWISGDLWPVHETHAPTTRLIDETVDWAVRTLADEDQRTSDAAPAAVAGRTSEELRLS